MQHCVHVFDFLYSWNPRLHARFANIPIAACEKHVTACCPNSSRGACLMLADDVSVAAPTY
jgi:hypothetical protein